MKKADYLKELENRISRLPAHERAEILADYNEHFEIAAARGKTEEEIAKSLGAPRAIAQSIMMNSLVQEAKSASGVGQRAQALLRILLLVMVLAPFNFLMLAGPFFALFVSLLTGWLIPLAFVSASVWALALFFKAGVLGFGAFSGLSVAAMFVCLLSTSFLAGMILLLLTRGSLKLLVGYFKWNIDFISAKRA